MSYAKTGSEQQNPDSVFIPGAGTEDRFSLHKIRVSSMASGGWFQWIRSAERCHPHIGSRRQREVFFPTHDPEALAVAMMAAYNGWHEEDVACKTQLVAVFWIGSANTRKPISKLSSER